MGSSSDPFIFLIDAVFSIYILIMYLRFILQQVGADFYNPVSQFVVRATQPLVKPARKIIPPAGRIDSATVLLTLLLILLKLVLISLIAGYALSLPALLLLSLKELLILTFNVFIFAIFIQALISWIHPDPYNPVNAILHSLTWPVLSRIRRFMPDMGAIDFSSLVALIGLMFLKLLVLRILPF